MRHGAHCCCAVSTSPTSFPTWWRAKISAATDPRERLLRRRRRALRWGLIFTAGCLFWGVVTAVLAAWGWFALLLEITGGIAVVQAIPATLLLIRYRWLRSEPLPAQRPTSSRRLPPPSSAARSAMSALGASERGFFSLLGVMERGNMLPATEIRDLTAAATKSSAAMAATAAEVVSMERAVNGTPQSRSYLVAHHQRVHRAVECRRASVQRNGHRRSAIGVVGERRSRRCAGSFTTALPRRAGRRDRSSGRLVAGFRRARRATARV